MLNNQNQISRLLEDARRKLLETGTRNRLIHVNRQRQRANCLNVINERSDSIYQILRVENKTMRFRAMGKDKANDEQEGLEIASIDDNPNDNEGHHDDKFIETPLGPEAQDKRLLRLSRDARTAEEEQGINILYLAMGFLKWRESKSSDVWREAPLVLIPVDLVRNQRTSTYDIKSRDDDISTNLPLRERLRQDFGIVLPEIPDIDNADADGNMWLPSEYFELVRKTTSGQPEWGVDQDGIQLGFFSFAKLLMHHDLNPDQWPDDMLGQHELLSPLLSNNEVFPKDDPIFGDEDRLDKVLDPADIIHVVDADGSQTKVIEEVRNGSNMVVQGPPGTGKSQTITNIIAAAVHDRKSVLFVAEKMAALSVVHGRLAKAGLRNVCLELHSRKSNKKSFVQELGSTLEDNVAHKVSDSSHLRNTRDKLNRIDALLHTPLSPSNENPFNTISEIVGFRGKKAQPPSVPNDGFEKLDKAKQKAACEAIANFVNAINEHGSPEDHPFRGVGNLALQPTDVDRLKRTLCEVIPTIENVIEKSSALAELTSKSEVNSIDEISSLSSGIELLRDTPTNAATTEILFGIAEQTRLSEVLNIGVQWASAHSSAQNKFSNPAWKYDLGEIRRAIVRGQSSLWARWLGPYRRLSTEFANLLSQPMPTKPEERLKLLDELADVQDKRKTLSQEESWLADQFGTQWRGERTQFADLLAVSAWLKSVKESGWFLEYAHLARAFETISDPCATVQEIRTLVDECRPKLEDIFDTLGFTLLPCITPISEIKSVLMDMRDNIDRYPGWVELQSYKEEVRNNGAGAIIEAMDGKTIEPENAKQEFEYACAEARWNAARKMHPELGKLQGQDRHKLVLDFQGFEKQRIASTKSEVLSRHRAQMPNGHVGEMGFIRGEIARKRGHKPIRKVMENAGNMIQRIKPVMLMSPISVAQFLPPKSVKFDLLVIDEASQVRPEDALGVLARAKQIVVVGDKQQLPPTSFFDRMVDDAEEEEEDNQAPSGAKATEMESILSLCEARGVRTRMLEWHYRSRDPSLIRVSNAEFYEDKLVLPPSPLQSNEDYGLKFRPIAGVYARGGSGIGRKSTNRIEAEAVANAVAKHARDWPTLSLGIVAFSKQQTDMLTELLEQKRRNDCTLDEFLHENKNENVFVKNIENVQGDERDVILISVGYGPQVQNGRLEHMNFGPVNKEGGERRLNVLFSRARTRCEVFSSFDPGDIDLNRAKSNGPRVLKKFLEFAKNGEIEQPNIVGEGADSPFEEDVANVIRKRGYMADPQVGTAGFRIDIGVRHPELPGTYLLAVECDGATYHSALWARERDRLRQAVLENHGWQFHRIWSTDWFYRRSDEIKRLEKALSLAFENSSASIRIGGANEEHSKHKDAVLQLASKQIEITNTPQSISASKYKRANVSNPSTKEPHETPIDTLARLVCQIVEMEGPIHNYIVAQRIAELFKKARTGNRITDATNKAITRALKIQPEIKRIDQFLRTDKQAEKPPIRDRSSETGNLLKADYLPPMEISAAANLIISESGNTSKEELIRAIAQIFGFQRVGPDLRSAIAKVVTTRSATKP